MSVLMKNSHKSVLPFPAAPEEPAASTIVVQIGNDRFAIHWEIEELPPAAPLVAVEARGQEGNCKDRQIAPAPPNSWRGHCSQMLCLMTLRAPRHFPITAGHSPTMHSIGSSAFSQMEGSRGIA